MKKVQLPRAFHDPDTDSIVLVKTIFIMSTYLIDGVESEWKMLHSSQAFIKRFTFEYKLSLCCHFVNSKPTKFGPLPPVESPFSITARFSLHKDPSIFLVHSFWLLVVCVQSLLGCLRV